MSRSEKHISAGKKPCDSVGDPHVPVMSAFCACSSRRKTVSSHSGLIAWCMPTITGSSRRRPPDVLHAIASRYDCHQFAPYFPFQFAAPRLLRFWISEPANDTCAPASGRSSTDCSADLG